VLWLSSVFCPEVWTMKLNKTNRNQQNWTTTHDKLLKFSELSQSWQWRMDSTKRHIFWRFIACKLTPAKLCSCRSLRRVDNISHPDSGSVVSSFVTELWVFSSIGMACVINMMMKELCGTTDQ
jgi:hypothetical protein